MVKKLSKKRLSFLFLVPSILVPITLVSCGNSNETSQQEQKEEASDIVNNSNNQYFVAETQNGSVLMFSGNSSENKTVDDLKNEIWNSADWDEQTIDSMTTYTALNFRETNNFQTFLSTYASFKNINTTTAASVDLNLSDVNSDAISSDLVTGTVSIVESKSEQFSYLVVGFIFELKEGAVWKNSQKNYIVSFTMTFMNMNTTS
ncbi:MAG: hypothetical protein K2H56_00940 [Malacoplasma sp.]|nr:hypothetical protein [Malacoplasma sp.]MDE7099689.1 hypothetical protein [Malacoplasma sp.]